MEMADSNNSVEALEEILFHQVVNEHDNGDVLALLNAFEEKCSGLLMNDTPMGDFSKILPPRERLSNLILERNVWKLMFALCGERSSLQFCDEDVPSSEIASCLWQDWDDQTVIKKLYERDQWARESQIVVDWLEENAQHVFRDSTDNLTLYSENLCWENTFHAINSRKITGELDPDAPIRNNCKLHPGDEKDEAFLLKTIFRLVRSGQQEFAETICRRRGQSWRASTLSGWRLFSDPNRNAGQDHEELIKNEGNMYRSIWKSCCKDLLQSPSFSVYEKAIYGALCGSIDAILPVCSSWEDCLWAYYKCAVEQRVDQELLLCQRQINSLLSMDTDTGSQIQNPSISQELLDPRFILSQLAACDIPVVREQAENPFNILASFIILNDHHSLLASMYRWVAGSDQLVDPESDYCVQFSSTYPYLLRIVAHMVLVLRSLCYDLNQDQCELLLEVYTRHLIKTHQKSLVALYTTKLSETRQVVVYSTFLEEISDSQERQEYLKLAENFGLNVAVIAKTVVVNIRNHCNSSWTTAEESANHPVDGSDLQIHISPTDAQQIEAIEWLCFDDHQRHEALLQFNAIMRTFILSQNLDAAFVLSSKLPPNSLQLIQLQWDSKENESPPSFIRNAIHEYLCIQTYLKVHEAYQEWKDFHSQGQLYSSKDTHHLKYMQWKTAHETKAQTTVDCIYSVLLFPQGWLSDDSFEETANHLRDEAADQHQRFKQLRSIRKMCIPRLCFLLHKVLFDTQQYTRCIQIADLIADEYHQLYTQFSPDELFQILSSIRLASIELLKTNSIPFPS